MGLIFGNHAGPFSTVKKCSIPMSSVQFFFRGWTMAKGLQVESSLAGKSIHCPFDQTLSLSTLWQRQQDHLTK